MLILRGNHGQFRAGKSSGFPVAWTPAVLEAALAVWLDAGDTASIVLNGSTVSQWNDKSGNARHVSQATAAQQPAYQTTGFNGRPTIAYTSNDWLENTVNPHTYISRTSFGIFWAGFGTSTINQVSNISNPHFWSIASSNYAPLGAVLRSTGTITTYDYVVPSAAFFSAIQSYTLNAPAIFESSKNVNTLSSQVNGVRVNTALPAGQETGTAPNVMLKLGSNYNMSVFLDGVISEFIITSTQPSTANRERIEGYLAWKWGLQNSLPAGHPYRFTAPTL